jgi:hypothetical protein
MNWLPEPVRDFICLVFGHKKTPPGALCARCGLYPDGRETES